MDLNECFERKLLRKISPDFRKMEGSISISENKLLRANNLFQKDFFDETLISAYTSMFHIARALLYKDGIQEKSHYAVYIYINEKYSRLIPPHLIQSFKVFQTERHKTIYDFDITISKEQAKDAILSAEQFLQEIKKILKTK